MNIGIDIGTHKTVIFSTRDNGTALTDEFGSREIPTVLELTTPQRNFGKGVTSDSPKNALLRSRQFMKNIKDPKAQEHLFMFLEYLSRIIKINYLSGVLTVPESFDEEERCILKQLVDASSLRIGGFMTHITGAAACAAFSHKTTPANFIVVDFGHHRTSIGLFNYENGNLLAKHRAFVRYGASDFDDVIFQVLVNKYNLVQRDFYRERIHQVLCKIKKGLNELETVEVSVMDENFSNIRLSITRDEFVNGVAGISSDIKEFISAELKRPEMEPGLDCIEVVGNNSNSFIIGNIMSEFPHYRRMRTADSVAKGACLGYAVNCRRMNHHVDEICGRTVAMRVTGEKKKPVVIIKSTTPIGTTVNVKYNRSANFSVDVFDNGTHIGAVEVRVPEEEYEKIPVVKVSVLVSSFLTVEIPSVTICKGDAEPEPLEFEYKRPGLIPERIEEIKQLEEHCASLEREAKELGEFRNETEAFIDSLDEEINRKFPGLLTSVELHLIDDLRNEFFDSSCGTLKEEEERREKLHADLKPIQAKLSELAVKLKDEAEKLLEEAKPYCSYEKNAPYIHSSFNRICARLEHFIKDASIELGTFKKFDTKKLSELRREYEESLKKYKLMKETEEAEKRRKEAEEEKKEDEHAVESGVSGG